MVGGCGLRLQGVFYHHSDIVRGIPLAWLFVKQIFADFGKIFDTEFPLFIDKIEDEFIQSLLIGV
jgi:hypothetical protein